MTQNHLEDAVNDGIDPAFMRSVMGSFCSGVVVVTALATETAEPLGFTCQSFASLSLDPPLISFCPSRTSKTWPKIRKVGTFAINILADDHGEVSRSFARSGSDKYEGMDWASAPLGSPLIKGAAAWIECSLQDEFDAGDHTIVIGRVLSLDHDTDRAPLLFHRGQYGKLAED